MTLTTPATLATVVTAPPSGRAKAVLFDHTEYAASVILRGGDIPWGDPTAYSAFFAQAQGLLQPDFALLDLTRLYDHLTAANTRLETAMASRSRTGYALRTLLADGDLNKAVLEFATVFAQTARQPVVLRIPSPMAWLICTHRFGGADNLSDLSADDAENASMYVSDWLRAFAALPVSGILLDDRTVEGGHGHASVPLEAYTPIANVTSNYRWTLGQMDGARVHLQGHTTEGGYVPAAFWLEPDVELPAADFYVADIPRAALPEDVLLRLDALR